MNHDEFMDDLDATMKRLYDTFGKPDMRKPGADENPPRNYRCGYCGRWFPAGTNHSCCPSRSKT